MKLFRTILLVILAFAALPARAQQSAPNWTFNYVPTPAEWAFWFGKKVDFAGALPCIVTGCVFSGNVEVTGTSVPVVIAGDTWIAGQIGGGLTLVNGSGIIYNGSAGGLILQGKGTSNDIALRNSGGANAISIPTGTVTANITGVIFTGSVSAGVQGALNINGLTSGSATINTNSTGSLQLGNNQGSQNTVFNDGGNGTAFVIGNAGGTIANQITINPKTTGNAPTVLAGGTDTNVGLSLNAKGTGTVNIGFGGVGGGVVIDGNAPTSCSSTNAGTGSSCAFSAGSNNSNGTFVITAGTTASASGIFTVTFSNALGTNFPSCVFTYDDTGTPWNTTALPPHMTAIATTSVQGSWNNNGTSLTSASTYRMNYHCFGK